MRALVVLVCLVPSTALADTPNEDLIAYYGVRANYKKVKRDVLGWHKTTRNGCAAFVSTALRHVGIDVPLREKRDGWGISRITFALSDYLIEDLDWQRIDEVDQLEPGDVAFTTGYPDHVFVFAGWKSRDRRVAKVIDNKGFKISRPLAPTTDSDLAAFAYALRAKTPSSSPEESSPARR